MSRENVELVQRVVGNFNATGQLGPGFDAVFHPEVEFTWVMVIEGNRCVRWPIYADHKKALEAAGLSE